MFIKIGDIVFNTMHITTVKMDSNTYSARDIYSDGYVDDAGLPQWHTSYMIYVNTSNYKTEVSDGDRYEYTFYYRDKEEWLRVYDSICNALGVVTDVAKINNREIVNVH